MGWYVAILAIIYLGSAYEQKQKNKNLQSDTQKQKKKKQNLIRKNNIEKLLKDNINNEILINSEKLIKLGIVDLKGNLKSMDEDWIEVYCYNKNKSTFLKIEDISSLSLIK